MAFAFHRTDNFGNTPMVLRKVFTHMRFEDLKDMRLVSRLWCDVISNHRRFEEHRTTTLRGSQILYNTNNWMSVELSLPWRTVRIKRFSINYNTTFLKNTWSLMSKTITKVYFHQVKISCADLCRMLNYVSALTQVTFDDLQFNPDLTTITDQVPTFICCNHTPGMDNQVYREITQSAVPAPTITKVEILNQAAFPICVLENLARRSHGRLTEFTIRDSPKPPKFFGANHGLHPPTPSWHEIYPQIYGLMNSSTASLKRLELYNIGFNFFEHLTNTVGRNAYKITELVLGICLQNVMVQNRQFNFAVQDNVIDLVTQISPTTLQSLSLNIAYTQQTREGIENMLATLSNIHKLQIGIWVTALPRRSNINFQIPGICRLNELSIHPHPQLRHDLAMNEHLSYAFLNTINADNLESLSITSNRLLFNNAEFSLMRCLPNLLEQKFGGLKKLRFLQGSNISNEIVQSIIHNIPLLEELMIRDSAHLCDTGIMGTNENDCSKCKDADEKRRASHKIQLPGRNLCQLRGLKRLDLSGCLYVSDFSIESGFKFPKLKEINLSRCKKITNAGLLSLATNNPSLKTLKIFGKYANIDKDGLVAFITSSKSIQEIFMSNRIPGVPDFNEKIGGDQPLTPENVKLREMLKIQKEEKPTGPW